MSSRLASIAQKQKAYESSSRRLVFLSICSQVFTSVSQISPAPFQCPYSSEGVLTGSCPLLVGHKGLECLRQESTGV